MLQQEPVAKNKVNTIFVRLIFEFDEGILHVDSVRVDSFAIHRLVKTRNTGICFIQQGCLHSIIYTLP